MSHLTSLVRLLVLSSALVPVTALQAQAAAQPEQGEEAAEASGNEIIVTAQKIEQRAADVPITISAMRGERIQELGVTDLDEL